MKKFIAFMLLAVALLLPVPVSAADAAPTAETGNAETSADTMTAIPSADEIKQDVLDTIDKVDWTLSGVELWEDVKAWILNHLSTVVGAITALLTLIIGLATKFSFVPRIVKSFGVLFDSIKKWYVDNVDALKDFRAQFDKFTASLKGTVDAVEEQSKENNDLRHALDAALKENKELREHYISVESALLEAALLDAQQHQRLIQLSGMSCADLDAEYKDYKARVEAIQALIPGRQRADPPIDETAHGGSV